MMIIAVSGGIASMVAFVIMRGRVPWGAGFELDQRHKLLFLCSIRGLDLEAQRYRDTTSDVTYWFESDWFSKLAISDPGGEDANKRKQVLQDLLEYGSSAIAKNSRGVIHYNIARILEAQGQKEEANKHLKLAQDFAEDEVKRRLRVDPVFGKK